MTESELLNGLLRLAEAECEVRIAQAKRHGVLDAIRKIESDNNPQQEREVMYRLYCERETDQGHVVTIERVEMGRDALNLPKRDMIGLMLRDRQVMLTAEEAQDIATALAAASYDLEWRD